MAKDLTKDVRRARALVLRVAAATTLDLTAKEAHKELLAVSKGLERVEALLQGQEAK